MLHLSCSGASGLAEPWFVDLTDWLLGMLIKRVFSLGGQAVSTFSFSFASSNRTVMGSLAKFFMSSSRRWSSTPLLVDGALLLSLLPASSAISLLRGFWFVTGGVFKRDRERSCGLLLIPTMRPLEVLPLVLLSSWLLSRTIKSCSKSSSRPAPAGDFAVTVSPAVASVADMVVAEAFAGASSVGRSRCCLSRTTWDWRRAYRWLGRRSNWTLRRARFVWVVWYSVRPLFDMGLNVSLPRTTDE